MKRILSFLLLFITVIGCDSDPENKDNIEPETNLSDGKLTDFPPQEVNYTDIKITQPQIENNAAITEGEILITLPHTYNSLTLSLASVSFNTDKFSISPAVGADVLFSETEFVRYTVTAKGDAEKVIHYNVKVIKEKAPVVETEKLAILHFELLSKNKENYTDIDKITVSTAQSADSFLYALFPTTVDFSDLTPAIEYKGSTIEYRVNNDDFAEYPVATGLKIDFSYPNVVQFRVSNADNSQSTVYRIIADTNNPIQFHGTEPGGPLSRAEINAPNIPKNETYNGRGISTWTNVGNYPITSLTANEYMDVVTPADFLTNIFRVSLSKNSPGKINPGEEGAVDLVVSNKVLAGDYKATAVFNLTFNHNNWYIVNRATDAYVEDIAYTPVTLLISGNIVE